MYRKKIFVIAVVMALATSLSSTAVAKAATTASDDACKSAVAGYDKNFYVESCDKNFHLDVKGRVQVRAAAEKHDSDNGNDGTDAQSFMIRRARLDFSGYALTPKFTYDLQLDLGGIPTATDNNILYYAYANYKATDAVQVLAGLHKLFFNRGEVTSDGKLEFVDRSIASERYKLDRSIGADVHGIFEDKKIEYHLAAFNGRNTRNALNKNQEFGYLTHLSFSPLGNYGYDEGDLKDSEAVQFTVGAGAALWHEETANQNRVISSTADYGFKYRGWSSQGEAFFRNTDAVGGVQNDAGYSVQVGYFFIPKKLEFALRQAALLDDLNDRGLNLNMTNGSLTGLSGVNAGVDQNGDSANEYEYTGALSYYIKGHDIKIQAQYSLLMDGLTTSSSSLQNHIGMLQGQFSF